MKYVDYYAVLGVARDADLAQIKKAYRKLAHKYHPDLSKTPDSEEQFKNAAVAYATLKSTEKRAVYDRLGPRVDGVEMPEPTEANSAYGFDADLSGFADMDLSDLLSALEQRSGGHASRRTHRDGPRRGYDMVDTTPIDLVQATNGCSVRLAFIEAGDRREFEVQIPAGVHAGQKLRLRGKGGIGHNGGENGDLYLHIELKPHPVFRVERQDLYFDLSLSPWEAALGTEVTVPTLESDVVLTVPAGTSSGKILRLRGRGMTSKSGAEVRRGDMYGVVRIAVPAHLSQPERQLLEELSRISTFTPRHHITGKIP